MKNPFFFLLIISSLLFTGCGSDPTSAAQKIAADDISTQSNSNLKLKEFIKKNATKKQVNGVDMYEIEYQLTIEAVKGGGWVYVWPGGNNQLSNFSGFQVSPVPVSGNTNHQVKAGEIFTMKGIMEGQDNLVMLLKKTENGWVRN